MSSFKILPEITVRQERGIYYVIDGEKYDIHFPLHWAICHKSTNPEFPDDIAGPKDCLNCKTSGSIHNVFVAYCPNCAYYLFNETREGVGIETDASESLKTLSYMRGVLPKEIGEYDVDDYDVEVVTEDEEETAVYDDTIEPNFISLEDRMREFLSDESVDL